MTLSLAELALRLTIAALLGGLVGLNRDLRHKPAGLRTHALVALGAAALTAATLTLDAGTGSMDVAAVSRTMQGIITGIGFLGAGVILHRPDRQGVHGLTTAATIWVVAVVGMVCGVGRWQLAVVLASLLLAILVFGGPIERACHRWLGADHDAAEHHAHAARADTPPADTPRADS